MLHLLSDDQIHTILKRKPIALWKFNLILAIWLGIFLNFSFYKTISALTPHGSFKTGLLVTATVVIIVALYNLIFQILNWTRTTRFFASVFVVIGGFSAYFVNSLGVLITPDQIQNMLQTDVREVQDLWSLRLILWTFFMVVLPLMVIWTVKIQPAAWTSQVLKKS